MYYLTVSQCRRIRVGNSSFCSFALRSSLFRSKSLILNSNRGRIAHVALNKRATMSKSLPKTDGSDSLFSKSELLFHCFAHKKGAICLKNQKANSQPWQEDCTLSFGASIKNPGPKERYNYRPASKLMST